MTPAPTAPCHAFRSMGTDVRLISAAGADPRTFERAARTVRLVFAEEERRFSRFRSDSELTRVNARAGRPTRVTASFSEVVALALAAAERTGGTFDPTVLPVLTRLGYDRDFEEVLARARVADATTQAIGRWREIELHAGRIVLPPGVGLDLGGIAKGWTADRAAGLAVSAGLAWAIVNAGGDLRLEGDAPPGGIEVGIEDPEAPGSQIGRLRLDHGALATSSVRKRAWGPGLHHLIDPHTGAPAVGRVVQATAWAPACAEAEVLAKAALLDGPRTLDRPGAPPAVLVLDDGTVLANLAEVEEAA